jgi:hypothetical protein
LLDLLSRFWFIGIQLHCLLSKFLFWWCQQPLPSLC